jgi:FKBP-type peptidyl-prolyl cis-trans isomerase FkpA
MLQRTRLMISFCLLSLFTAAQTKTFTTAPAAPTVVSTQPSYNYKKLNANLSYAFIIDKPGKIHPEEGDNITVNMQSVFKNNVMFNTALAFKGKPAVYSVNKPSFKGDFIEAIMLMTPGDSMVCRVDADALYSNTKNKKPDYIKSGDNLQYFIKLISIKTKEQVQKEQQEAIMKQMKEQEAKQKAAAAKQMIADDKKLKAYFASHNISPNKTASGLYYIMIEEGTGEKVLPGDTLTVNYTGMLLNGTKFDSNEDSAFYHVSPYQFVVGRGGVIKGWDEGMALLKTGSKATFYIPSPLGYGTQPISANSGNPKGAPANSILIFNVHLISYKHPVPVLLPAIKTDSVAAPVKN